MPASGVSLTAVYEDILYTLTVENGDGDGEYTYEQVIDITADPAPEGEEFSMWAGDIEGVADVNSPTTTITMPAGNAAVTAVFEDAFLPLFDWNMEAADVVLDEGKAKQDLTNNGSITTGGTEPNPPGYGSVGAVLNGTDQYFSLENSEYGNRALNGTDTDGTIYIAFSPDIVSSKSHELFSFYRPMSGERQLNIDMVNGRPSFLWGYNDGTSVQQVKIYQTFSAGEEIIIALSLDASTKEFTFLSRDVDDDVYYSTTEATNPLSGTYNTGTSSLTIGARSDLASAGYAEGTIYWVKVYDEAHTEEKMKEIIENSNDLKEESSFIENTVVSNTFSVYPNPAQTGITINSLNSSIGKTNIEIYNENGKKVYRSPEKVAFPHQVDVSSYASGIYLIKVSDEDSQEILKIIKK
jgi:hypothetical protein